MENNTKHISTKKKNQLKNNSQGQKNRIQAMNQKEM